MHFLSLYLLRRFLPLFLLSILLPSCTKEKKEDKLPHYQSDIVKTSNAIVITWIKEQFEKSAEENICVSPFPLLMMSSALACGAEGETKEQLWKFAANSLCPQGNLPADFNEPSYLYHIRQINSHLAQGIPGYYLYNGLYTNNNTNLYSDYKERVQQNLNMDIVSVDFSHSVKIEKQINQTVRDCTNGLVQECLPPGTIRSELPYLMFNVLGFVGKWKKEFDQSNTTETSFHPDGGDPVTTPFMRDGINNFRETNQYTLFWLDYAQSTARFVVVLPEQNTKLRQLIKDMGKGTFEEYISLMNAPQKKFNKSSDYVRELYLPKFEFSTTPQDCRDFLQKEGVKECFLPEKANFTRMMPFNQHVARILQKCYLKIDEEGTKAYAVTTTEVESELTPEKNKEIRADKPFLCFIMDSKTNLILFIAILKDPTQKKSSFSLMDSDGNLP